jgi:hypothetical protein
MGEEKWGDDEVDEIEAGKIARAARSLEDKYKVHFRKVENVYDDMDKKWRDYSVYSKLTKFGKMTKRMYDRDYERGVEDVKQRRIDRNKPFEPDEEQLDDFDADFAQQQVDEIEIDHDRDYQKWLRCHQEMGNPENWLEEEREKGNVEDLPDSRVVVKVKPEKKRFMDKFKNFVVPGFDVKPPEVMER